MKPIYKKTSIKLTLKILLISCFFIVSFNHCKSDEQLSRPDISAIEDHPKPLPVDNNIVAHRGAYKKNGAPQNSLAAFQDAIDMRLFGIECDIRLTKDKKVVIYHDPVYNGLDIDKSTYEELKASGKLANGEDIPLFEDFVKKALEGKYTKIWADVKLNSDEYGGAQSTADVCVAAMEIARKHEAEHFVCFLITNQFVIYRAMSVSKGDFAIAFQSSDEAATYRTRGFEWASQPYGNFYPDNVEKLNQFKSLGIKMNIYNCDNVNNARWFIEQGVDQIASNDPEMVLKVLRGEL